MSRGPRLAPLRDITLSLFHIHDSPGTHNIMNTSLSFSQSSLVELRCFSMSRSVRPVSSKASILPTRGDVVWEYIQFNIVVAIP